MARFESLNRPVVELHEVSARSGNVGAYYSLKLPTGSVGGTNKAALTRYAAKRGYAVEFVPLPRHKKESTFWNIGAGEVW